MFEKNVLLCIFRNKIENLAFAGIGTRELWPQSPSVLPTRPFKLENYAT